MTTERPTGPDPSRNATDIGNGGNLPNSDNPSRVGGGFPTGAVEKFRRWLDAATPDQALFSTRSAMREVLAWIDRYVPRSLRDVEGVVVDGVGAIMLNGDDPFLESVKLVRVNGRTFVEETAVIAEPGREAALMALWSHLPANTSLGVKATRATYEAALDATIAALGRNDDGDPNDFAFRLGVALGELDSGQIDVGGFAFRVEQIIRDMIDTADDPDTVIDPGAAGRAMAGAAGLPEPHLTRSRPEWPPTPPANHEATNRARASLRRPLIEGLECVAGEETVDGLFPGDPGYVRPL